MIEILGKKGWKENWGYIGYNSMQKHVPDNILKQKVKICAIVPFVPLCVRVNKRKDDMYPTSLIVP